MEPNNNSELYLQYSNSFEAIKIYDKSLIISNLNIETDIWIDAEDIQPEEIDRNVDEILIKLQIFFDISLNNSIIFSKSNNWAFEKFIDVDKTNKMVNNNIILTPGEPGDDHLCLLLQSKFEAIGEGKIFFSSMSIKNTKTIKFTFVGEGRKILPNMNDWVGNASYHDEPWWSRNDLSTIDLVKSENVETPFYDIKFESIFLNKLKNHFYGNNILNDVENSETKIIRPKFKPRIIKNEE